MSKWIDALKSKSRFPARHDKADGIDTIQSSPATPGIASLESVVSTAPEEAIEEDQPHHHTAPDVDIRISESRDKADSNDTIPAPVLDNPNCVNSVRIVSGFENEQQHVAPFGLGAAQPPRDIFCEILGDETYTPPLKVPRDSGLVEMPSQGAMCAVCGGCAWRRGPGGTYHCDEETCRIEYPTGPTIRRRLRTRFLCPPTLVPDPCGICDICEGARWGHSPTIREAVGFDGWKRWFCMSCHRSEIARPDVQVFEGEACRDRR